MKRFAIIVCLVAMLSTPALAMQAMTDAHMNDVTGQAGVTIGIDNLIIEQSPADTAWADPVEGNAEGGVIVMEQTGNKQTTINGLLKIDVETPTADIKDGNDTILVAQNDTAIKLGLSELSLSVATATTSNTISLCNTTTFGGDFTSYNAGNADTLGTLYSASGTITIKSGDIYILAH